MMTSHFRISLTSLYYREKPLTCASTNTVFVLRSVVCEAVMDFCLSLYLSIQGEGEPFLSEYTPFLLLAVFGSCLSLVLVLGSDRWLLNDGSDRWLFRDNTTRPMYVPFWYGDTLGSGTNSSRVLSWEREGSKMTSNWRDIPTAKWRQTGVTHRQQNDVKLAWQTNSKMTSNWRDTSTRVRKNEFSKVINLDGKFNRPSKSSYHQNCMSIWAV